MKNKLMRLLMIGSIILSSCSLHNEDITSKKTFEYLADQKINGRLTGTNENKIIEEYLSNKFKELGLQPFHENYYQEYQHDFYEYNKNNISIEIEDNNLKEYSLVLGKDYLPQAIYPNLNISCLISDNVNESKDKAVLLEDIKIFNAIKDAKVILIKKSIFTKNVNLSNTNIIPIIQINEQTFDSLKKSKGTIDISCNITNEKITARNIVGKIPDTVSDNAIIISAHLDHVGSIGDNIYPGAIDNASGITTLLETVQKFIDSNIKINSDIIFCCFNGEESGLQGSKAFIDEISKKYKEMVCINIDCVGIKNDNEYVISSTQSQILSKDVFSFFTENNIKAKLGSTYTSDHDSFEQKNIHAITIGQDPKSLLHTTNDTIDNIDYEIIKSLSSNIYDYIIKRNAYLFENIKKIKSNETDNKVSNINHNEKIDEELNNIRKKLNFNQYITVKIDTENYSVQNNFKEFNNINDFKSELPFINIIESHGDYKLSKVSVGINIIRKSMKDTLIDTIYDGPEIGKEAIKSIILTYENIENNKYFIELNLLKLEKKYDPKDFYEEEYTYKNKEYKLYKYSGNHAIHEITFNANINKEGYFCYIRKYRLSDEEYEGKKVTIQRPDWFNNSTEESINFAMPAMEILEKIFN